MWKNVYDVYIENNIEKEFPVTFILFDKKKELVYIR